MGLTEETITEVFNTHSEDADIVAVNCALHEMLCVIKDLVLVDRGIENLIW